MTTIQSLTTQALTGSANLLRLLLGVQAPFDPTMTHNALRNVFPNLTPSSNPTLGYFGIGTGGSSYGGPALKMVPNPLTPFGGGLFNQIPFLVVPQDQDISQTEMKNYALRGLVTVPNTSTQMIAYWFKRIDLLSVLVQLLQTDPNTGNTQVVTQDPSILQPTVPVIPTVGSTTAVTARATAQASLTLPITGQEVHSAINALYGGNASMSVDEIGLFTGTDMPVTVNDHNGNPFTYTEAAGVQMFQHRTMEPIAFPNPSTTPVPLTYNLISGNLSILQSGS